MFDVCWLAMMLLFTGAKYFFSWGSDEGGVGVDQVGDDEWEPIKLITSPGDSDSGCWQNIVQDSV
jgi:hypothetical protein